MSDQGAPTGEAARHVTGRARAITSLAGVIPGAIALPFVLRTWTPTWFVVCWVALYVGVSAFFIFRAIAKPTDQLEQEWSVAAAIMFAAIPVSAVVWSTRPQDYWAAVTIAIIFIAFETAALPFLNISEWRVGVLIVGASIVVSGLVVLHPVVALAFGPIVLTIINSADRARGLKLELEQKLGAVEQSVLQDPLTGLLNRRGLDHVAEQLNGQEVTLALIDVDRFKMVNDTHGHQVGDQVLAQVSTHLRERFGDDFELARLGGDEFVAIAAGAIEIDESYALPVRTVTRLHGHARTIECGLSIGVAHGTSLDSAQKLLSEAGFAMREAKGSGTDLATFGDELSQRRRRTLQVASMATGHADHGTFFPVGQIIMAEDQIVGCELLVRWKRPDGRILRPSEFLPMANETGLMATINNLMLDHAVSFAARFNNRPMGPFVSVNVSAPHLSEATFADRIEDLLQRHRVPAERLMIEITETDQLGDYDDWESTASRLRSLGVRLAMDDFGAGYSSLERLQHLPITHLKFDRSLVQAVSGPFGEIIGGVSRFAHALNVGIIAEGVETLDEYESMRAFDVKMFQGYHFHRPEPLDQVEIRIIENHVRSTAASTASD